MLDACVGAAIRRPVRSGAGFARRLLLAIAVAGLVSRPSAGGTPAVPDDGEGALRSGSRIYASLCSACHGREGRGDGAAARELDPWPRDFKLAKFRSRSTLSGQPPLRSDLEEVVRRGRPGSAMPAFGGLLSENEVAEVVSFVLTLGARRTSGPPPEALPIPEFPPLTGADLSNGRAVYLILGCWNCHGADGAGHGPSAANLRSDEGQPIRPRDFRYEPFKGGRSPRTIARAALSGLSGTPMPSHAEILVIPREAIDALSGNLPPALQAELDGFRRSAPPAAEVDQLDDAAWERARNRNLSALSYYVLSLSRRGQLSFRLFRQEPEREGRTP